MGFILLGFVLAIIGEVFIIKLYWNGEKQLAKYNKEHSDVEAASAEVFIEKLNSISTLTVSNIECNGSRVNLKYQNNLYVINVENGIAAVEYDRNGCGFKLSSLGKILRLFKFSKAAKKAVEINYVMDCVANKDTSLHQKENQKVKTDTKLVMVSFVAMVICLIIGVVGMTGGLYEDAINQVKDTEYFAGMTYGELIEAYLVEPEWTAFKSDTNTAVVEVNGLSVEDETICIQFLGEYGFGFNSNIEQKFTLSYLDADGVSLDADAAMQIIYEYLYN